MKDPNLYYAKNGQRQCLKCKQFLAKEYRRANRERQKEQRRARIKAAKKLKPRKEKPLRIQVKRREARTGKVLVEGSDV
jgi:hypothetical protein